MDNQEQQEQNKEQHKRRVRYKGTHPRNFKEKYKEHQPDKYADTIQKVINKGSTPAGMHISICVDEILDFLQIKPGQKGLDATLGYGGHTSHMLKCLGIESHKNDKNDKNDQGHLNGEGHINSLGHLYALDIDPIEIVKTKKRLEDMGFGPDILTIIRQNFGNVAQVSEEVGRFDFMLADLGVSSMQIDNPERGFSYKTEGPLDLRLNPESGVSAAERLKDITQVELEGMLIENSDEPYATEISKAMIQSMRKGKPILTTSDLREIIENTLQFLPADIRKDTIKKSCQRTFQALRIDVNSEFEVLESFLEALPDVLAPGGRIAILTFHSGEDRLVKRTFKRFYNEGIFSEISKDVIRPSAEECNRNGRARSTKMRWAIRS
ncbi:16S rRNA (cytosine(1402)-N(4))-methyltransferase RsmH [Anaeromicropila herbilytica]|uniref:Ribosomal RNA small subunit methyltransferase H n=1 Tax=Anaeromicropila herbilytica TaxID=2785025 RepID=A0A7R7IDL7_9FIRM|nr:16S rRNA (cytosine(1402)-N(4))-methyltransferase RsmH [Anaeromicropila herbilytica]BCN31848.1 ribosomal RNA small subunit methyltransferase H [Anaeromicropila herbilytica]